MSDISDLRRDYGHGKLDIGDLLPDPIAQFKRWFEEALAAKIVDPNAMSLATATPSGETTLRTVLLKGYGHDGFVFFTNLQSRKARALAVNPEGTLVTISNWGFSGTEEQVVNKAIDCMGGFSLVLAGLKAWLEHKVELNLVADHHPEAHKPAT